MGCPALIHLPSEAEVIELGSRRPVRRQNRGRAPSGSLRAVTPLTIVSSVQVFAWFGNGMGIDTDGSNHVIAWADQSSNHNDLAEPTNPPDYIASRAQFNNRPCVLFDGASQVLRGAWNAAYPRQYHIVFRVVSWGPANDGIFASGALGAQDFFCQTASPGLALYSGTSFSGTNNNAPVGTARRARCTFTNSVADRLLIGSFTSAGAINTGSTAGVGFTLGGNGAGANSNIEVAELLITEGAISAGEETALQALWTAQYGSGIYA